MLKELMYIYGEDDWPAIGLAMGLAPRTVREHYMRTKYNTSNWTRSEDMLLRRLVRDMGLRRWTSIAQALGTGRSRENCRNRWTKIGNIKPELDPPFPVVDDDFFHFDEE
jgi:hypothetical protein